MEFTAFTAGKDDAGKRLDRVLRSLLDGSSINIFQALRKKLIKVNDSKAEASQRVNEGDCIQIASFLIPRAEGDISPLPDIPCKGQTLLEVIFRNDDLVFINKPAGISVQPSSAGGENISGIIKREWEAQGSHGSLSFTPAPLHRLDRYTSGLLAISASAKGADWFSKAMQAHEIKKTYIGICRGKLEKEELWQDRISACGKAGGKEFHKVKATSGTEEQEGFPAITTATPLCQGRMGQDEITLVEYRIETGRKHQIRAQSALHGHPLRGDSAYGGAVPAAGGPTVGTVRHSRFFLHAISLDFPPDNPLNLPARLEAPLPQDFEKFLTENFPVSKLAKTFNGKYNRLIGL